MRACIGALRLLHLTRDVHASYVAEELQRMFHFDASAVRFVVIACQTEHCMVRGSLVLRKQVSLKWAVLQSLCRSVGLCVRDVDEFDGSDKAPMRSFDQQVVFSDLDFSFTERVKQLDVVDRARGMAQFLRASESLDTCSRDQSYTEFMRAFHILDAAVNANPCDAWLSWLVAEVSRSLWQLLMARADKTDADVLLMDAFAARAQRHFEQAIAKVPCGDALRWCHLC